MTVWNQIAGERAQEEALAVDPTGLGMYYIPPKKVTVGPKQGATRKAPYRNKNITRRDIPTTTKRAMSNVATALEKGTADLSKSSELIDPKTESMETEGGRELKGKEKLSETRAIDQIQAYRAMQNTNEALQNNPAFQGLLKAKQQIEAAQLQTLRSPITPNLGPFAAFISSVTGDPGPIAAWKQTTHFGKQAKMDALRKLQKQKADILGSMSNAWNTMYKSQLGDKFLRDLSQRDYIKRVMAVGAQQGGVTPWQQYRMGQDTINRTFKENEAIDRKIKDLRDKTNPQDWAGFVEDLKTLEQKLPVIENLPQIKGFSAVKLLKQAFGADNASEFVDSFGTDISDDQKKALREIFIIAEQMRLTYTRALRGVQVSAKEDEQIKSVMAQKAFNSVAELRTALHYMARRAKKGYEVGTGTYGRGIQDEAFKRFGLRPSDFDVDIMGKTRAPGGAGKSGGAAPTMSPAEMKEFIEGG